MLSYLCNSLSKQSWEHLLRENTVTTLNITNRFYLYTVNHRPVSAWGPPPIKIGGGHKWQHKYTVYILYTGAAPEFWFGGNIRQNFICEFLSSPVMQWRLQDFGWEKTFSTNLLIKDFWKILKKFIKQFAQKFKISPKFFKNKI